MQLKSTRLPLCLSALVATCATANAVPLVTSAVDDRTTVAITGERSPRLAQAIDRGRLADATMLDHVMLITRRPPDRQAAFDTLTRDQQTPGSPRWHQWLKPSELRAYGPAQADLDATLAWLRARGLAVSGVSPSGMSIDFSGTAGAVAAAFHTVLHTVTVAGETHVANMTDLAIPAALAPVVRGATLSNFFPRPNRVARSQFTVPVSGGNAYAVGPTDFATIYDLNPLLSGNSLYSVRVAGFGVTVAVVEQTDILPADWASFRHSFHIDRSRGTLAIEHPHCADPGTTFDEAEAALDAEWVGAAAPDAAVIEASCPSTSTTFGVETTLRGLVEYGTAASVLSISYGGAEIDSGLTFLAGWENLVQEGAAEGLSILISSGDSGSSAIRDISYAGVAVNGLSSNAYNTTVGGTDFYDTALGETAAYWRPGNGPALGSAKSYVPEIPWDNSCAGAILVAANHAQDAVSSCNLPVLPAYEQQGIGGTGGRSIYYAKPSFQMGVPGMPHDGVRDQPDVSMFAANGLWSHFLVFCMSDPNWGGTSCDYSVPANVLANGSGGTSFATPAFAGVAALIVQTHAGAPQGNLAPRLYAIARAQFNQPLLVHDCNATRGNLISTACVFHNVTAGDIAEPCYAGTAGCYTNANATNRIGVLRVRGIRAGAYPATPGYSLATGLGSVDILNLLYNY